MNLDAKILKTYWQVKFNKIWKTWYTVIKSVDPRMQGWFNIHEPLEVIKHINRNKDRPHNQLNRCRKAFDKI
jgi:hypothetical protein